MKEGKKENAQANPKRECTFFFFTFYFFFFFFTVYNRIVPMGFLPWEIRVAFPGESQLRESRATQPTVHAGCFSVFIIHGL